MVTSNGELVTTVQVGGIPLDTTDVEFTRWFLFASGFDRASITMTSTSGQAGLVRFSSLETAFAAIYVLNGRHVPADDPPEGVYLTAELASVQLKSASAVKRTFTAMDQSVTLQAPLQAQQFAAEAEAAQSIVASPVAVAAQVAPAAAAALAAPAGPAQTKVVEQEIEVAYKELQKALDTIRAPPSVPSPGKEAADSQQSSSALSAAAATSLQGWLGEAPSAVMMVSNLSSDASEEQLLLAFKDLPGFLQLNRTCDSAGRPCAYLRFESADRCKKALDVINSRTLLSAPNESLDCQFADTNTAQSDTLTIPNIPARATQQDVQAALGTLPGLVELKRGRGKGLASTLRFDSAESAAAAAETVRATTFPCAPSVPLECHFVHPPAAPSDVMAISNIPQGVSEEELQASFRELPGFLELKSTRMEVEGTPIFLRFNSIDSCAKAMQAVRATTLPGAPRTALECHFAAASSAPSDVLVVSNLSSQVTEQELQAAFGSLPGFLELKFTKENSERPLAFLRFDSVESCAKNLEIFRCSAMLSAPDKVLEFKLAPPGTATSDTMTIANLSPLVSEEELMTVLTPLAGFRKLSYTHNMAGRKVASVKFNSVPNCALAMQRLNCSSLPSAPQQLISCEFGPPENKPRIPVKGVVVPPVKHAPAPKKAVPPKIASPASIGSREGGGLIKPGLGIVAARSTTAAPSGISASGAAKDSAINPEDRAPLNTLVISEMPTGLTEKELSDIIGAFCNGFEKVKLEPLVEGKMGSCRVKFKTVAQATAAMKTMKTNMFTLMQVYYAEEEMEMPKTVPPPTPKAAVAAEPLMEAFAARQALLEAQVAQSQAEANPLAFAPPGLYTLAQANGAQAADTAVLGAGAGGRCSTLFTSNLQPHVTEEDLVEFFSGSFEGFVRLKFAPPSNGRGGMCWIRFATIEHADNAMHLIKSGGYRMACDPTKTLQIDYAKNDLDCRGVDARAGVAAAAQQVAAAVAGASVPLLGNTPCDTMFIGALAAEVTEQELLTYISLLPGFVKLKYVSGATRPVAFAQFDSVANCAQAVRVLHGKCLPSAPTHPLDCQYSKNSLDNKRPRMA
mmetsp:Transcript_92682/g.262067  ORF Transcript_92682/g.262067 Transcript_92682/m.262067 type:complete len:1080 (-) Transcript_92682:11-3250(-)